MSVIGRRAENICSFRVFLSLTQLRHWRAICYVAKWLSFVVNNAVIRLEEAHMRRREFITLLAGAATWPLGARAQPRSVPTIGFMGPTAPQAWAPWTKAFVDRFADLGWVDGRTVKIVYRWANGQIERASELAAELVELKVDLIVTSGSATRPAMKATSQIPI